LRELALDQHMQWVQTRTGFLVDGRLHSLSSSWEFLRFPPLGLIDKLRLGWTIWHASRVRDWRRLEQIPVADWLVCHSGRRTFERIWLPLLKAKLGAAWQRTSAAFIWATIQRMYAARKSGQKREMFGYLPGGYARMLAAFRRRLEDLGVTIHTSSAVDEVRREDGADKVAVRTASGDSPSFDRVIVTAPAPLAARLCPELTSAERQKLAGVEYLGIVCASLLLRRPISAFYVTNITDAAPFTGVIEMTALVDPAQFSGRALVYLPKYAAADDEIWTKTDDTIRAEFLAGMIRLYPAFDPADVLAFRISRVRHVFALSTLDYSRRVPPAATSTRGLFLVNSSQIVNGTLNVNETIRLADAALPTVLQPLPPPDTPNRTADVVEIEEAEKDPLAAAFLTSN
jgi:protoporphyrinogen oxidase